MKQIPISIFFLLFYGSIQAQIPDSAKSVLQKDTFYNIDEFPSFPGGDAALFDYLRTNINYPKEAVDSGIHGTVFVRFVIEVDGSISQVTVLRGIGYGCDEEAIRVIQNMPNWIPAKYKGTPERAQFQFPVIFALHNSKTEKTKKVKSR
jgi:TonB family protein